MKNCSRSPSSEQKTGCFHKSLPKQKNMHDLSLNFDLGAVQLKKDNYATDNAFVDFMDISQPPSVGTQSNSSSEYFSKTGSLPTSATSSIASDQPADDKCCMWDGCYNSSKVSQSELLDHLKNFHVVPQTTSIRRKYYYCLWKGCRVYKTPSVSRTWLERHILNHTQSKGKPFPCIFDSCSERFASSELLERHVRRSHLSPTDSCQQRSADCPNDGSYKRPFKRRQRLRLYKIRSVDFYAEEAQMVVSDRLQSSASLRRHLSTRSDEHPSVQHFELRKLLSTPHTLMGERVSMDGKREVLVAWRGALSSSRSKPSMWVKEEDMQLAQCLASECI